MSHNYRFEVLNSKDLEVPRKLYQRSLNAGRVESIVAHFDERIANEPKVSYRDGRYFVVDGQHTLAARVQMNGGKPILIRCKVYYALSEKQEALMFAEQFGESAALTVGAKFRALLFGEDPEAIAFRNATESTGIKLSFTGTRRNCQLCCLKTAFGCFKRVGSALYTESLRIIVDAWGGRPDSLRAEVIMAVVGFVEMYADEYNRKRLVTRLRASDPRMIAHNAKMDVNLAGLRKYINQVFRIYNGSCVKNALPMRF